MEDLPGADVVLVLLDRLPAQHNGLSPKVDAIVSFVTETATGDVVVTTSDQQLEVGDGTGRRVIVALKAPAPTFGVRSTLACPTASAAARATT
jgi:hypothetical protein